MFGTSILLLEARACLNPLTEMGNGKRYCTKVYTMIRVYVNYSSTELLSAHSSHGHALISQIQSKESSEAH